jgi:signal transduction histidine kinase
MAQCMLSRSNHRQDSPGGSPSSRAAARPEAQLAAAIAHELKNRLAGISAGVQILAAEFGDGDPRRTLLGELRAEIRRVDAIALDLLRFAHPRALHVQPADVRALVLELLAAMSLETELARHRLQVSIDEDLLLPIDPLVLEQTIRSLVLDAARALPSGGTISVRGTRSSQSAILEVSAAGPALQRDRRAALEPFSERTSLASGLELALARRDVEAHGGRLELGEGARKARFRIELPLRNTVTQSPGPTAQEEP